MPNPFLSDEWIAEARAIRNAHAGEAAIDQSIRINQVITDVPFGDGTVNSYIDTSSGVLEFELGQLDDPDATISTDYETAQRLFVDQDQAAAMQAFIGGKIRIQGDMMKVMMLQTAMPGEGPTQAIAEQIKAITTELADTTE